MIKEDKTYKPTLNKPVNQQSKNFEKNFKKTMTQYNPNSKLNEVDDTLSEAEQSLKKKIFSLAKMEALVFSDPKLSAVYDEMSVNGEEKYGYHYNETIMNMLFNDYVLNSPKYLQKYKMAIPKEKKRRDQSGINQLKKAGEEIMKKSQPKLAPSGLPKQDKKPNVTEDNESLTPVVFLVNEKDSENPDLFAYFPEENYDKMGNTQMGYSHIGQHSAVHPEYAEESREATPEEYAPLKAELESLGYNLDVLNGQVNETTSAGSAGGAAGYVGYAGPAAWGSGDLMKTKGKSKVMRKPIWKGGTIIAESDYLTDPSGFQKFVETLNENIDDTIINGTNAFNSDTVKNWNNNDKQIELNTMKTGVAEGISPDMYSTKEDLKELLLSIKARGQQFDEWLKYGSATLAGEALYTVAVAMANKLLPMSWNELPDTNSMWDYIDENGNMGYERLKEAVKEAANDRMSADDMGFGGLDEENSEEPELGSQSFNKGDKVFDKLHNTQGTVIDNYDNSTEGDNGDIRLDSDGNVPIHQYDKTGKPIGYNLTKVDEEMPQKVDEIYADALIDNDIVDIKPQKGEKPFILNDKKYQYEIAKYADGHYDNVVYSFSDDVYYDYRKWRELMGLNEDTQTMIQNNGTSMSNKAVATGDQSSNVDMGARSTGGGGMSETIEYANKLMEEINKELDAFSIHHNKLKKMAEDRKPSALVLRDRVGSENEKNFKSDLQHSGTKEIIDVEKELQWKDQQTDVDDPQKLGLDLEKKEIKVTDAEGEEHLKNVGDSANDKGDEIPKRNRTSDEQHDVDMHRLGQQDLVYDNEPGKRFEDRMKADMGEKLYKERQEKMKWRSEAPMYNKDPQPVIDPSAVDKVQFNKEKSTWNEREGLKETMITGRFADSLGKKYIKDFRLDEVKIVKSVKEVEDMFQLDFTGFGNKYKGKTEGKKVLVNEGVDMVLSENKFFTNGKEVFALKNPVQKLNETASKTKPVVNEQFEKMKHLSGYRPESFTDTKNVKKNRGF